MEILGLFKRDWPISGIGCLLGILLCFLVFKIKDRHMLITDNFWESIRENFTEEEKKELYESISGATICPKGITIDADKLDEDLLDKLNKLKHTYCKQLPKKKG